MRIIGLWAMLLILLYALQTSLLTFISFDGFSANLMLLMTVSIAFLRGHKYGVFFGFMAGLFVGAQDFAVRSNRESGSGRSDLLVLPVSVFERAFVIELKAVKPKKGQKTVTREDMDNTADEALKQIMKNAFGKDNTNVSQLLGSVKNRNKAKGKQSIFDELLEQI